MLRVFPFQKDMELRLETAIFCEDYCGIAAYTCLEMDAVLLRGCAAIPLLLSLMVLHWAVLLGDRVALGQTKPMKGNQNTCPCALRPSTALMGCSTSCQCFFDH